MKLRQARGRYFSQEDWIGRRRAAAFKQGQRFRAGIEGRISVLMRGHGMKRCRPEGAERFALFVGAAVLANNLMIVAALLTKRSSRRGAAGQAALSYGTQTSIGNANAASADSHYRNGQAKLSSWPSGSVR